MADYVNETPFRIAARFAAFYGALFLVLGVMLPFWPVWLKSRGLDAGQIGLVLAIGPWLRVIADPLITRGCRPVRSRESARWCCLPRSVWWRFPGSSSPSPFWLIVLVTIIFAPIYHVLIPLGDSQTMVAVVRDKLDYGRIRLWGSATFIAGTFGAGWLLTDRTPDVIVPVVFAGLLLVLADHVAVARAERAGPGGGRQAGSSISCVTAPFSISCWLPAPCRPVTRC